MQLLEQLARGCNMVTSESISLDCAVVRGYLECMLETMDTNIVMEGGGGGFNAFKMFCKKIFQKLKQLIDKLISFIQKNCGTTVGGTTVGGTTVVDVDGRRYRDGDLKKVISNSPYTGPDLSTWKESYIKTVSFVQNRASDLATLMITIQEKIVDNKNVVDCIENIIDGYSEKSVREVFEEKSGYLYGYIFNGYHEFQNFFINWCNDNGSIRTDSISYYNGTISKTLSRLKLDLGKFERFCEQIDDDSCDIDGVKECLNLVSNCVIKLANGIASLEAYIRSELKNTVCVYYSKTMMDVRKNAL